MLIESNIYSLMQSERLVRCVFLNHVISISVVCPPTLFAFVIKQEIKRLHSLGTEFSKLNFELILINEDARAIVRKLT